jgi:hypothetical protein
MVYQVAQVFLDSEVHAESKDRRVNLVHQEEEVWME